MLKLRRETIESEDLGTLTVLTLPYYTEEIVERIYKDFFIKIIGKQETMSSSKCKIEVPNQLPETGLTRVQGKSWKDSMLIYLKQNDSFLPFLPGGRYEVWISAEDFPDRIKELDKKSCSF